MTRKKHWFNQWWRAIYRRGVIREACLIKAPDSLDFPAECENSRLFVGCNSAIIAWIIIALQIKPKQCTAAELGRVKNRKKQSQTGTMGIYETDAAFPCFCKSNNSMMQSNLHAYIRACVIYFPIIIKNRWFLIEKIFVNKNAFHKYSDE